FLANVTPPSDLYLLSLHDALPISSWNELVAILRSLIDETAIRKNTREKTLPFLQENTWVSRASDIKQWGLEAMIAGPRSSPLTRSEEHTSELHSRGHLLCRLLLAQ